MARPFGTRSRRLPTTRQAPNGAASLRSKAFLDGDAGTGSYTTVAGDRLVVEFGHRYTSGSSISGSSRWGSTATGGDVPENETTTSTTVRPWFECSLGIALETTSPPQVTQVTRYVNTASTPGGDGTTNDTVGVNRAFASLVTALTTLAATDWAGAKQQLRILCSGTIPDTGDATVTAAWNGRLSPECYLEIIGDQPSALAISTSHYRCVDTEPAGFGVYGGGYVRLSRVGYQITVRSGDRRVFGRGCRRLRRPDGRAPGQRPRRCRQHCLRPHVRVPRHSGPTLNGPATKVTYTNCVAVGWTGSGVTHQRIHESCRDHRKRPALQLFGARVRGRVLGRIGHAREELRRRQLRGRIQRDVRRRIDEQRQQRRIDAPGTNPRNGVTPSFVSAMADLHLASGDTAWKDRGVNLSGDALFPVDRRRRGDANRDLGHWCRRVTVAPTSVPLAGISAPNAGGRARSRNAKREHQLRRPCKARPAVRHA